MSLDLSIIILNYNTKHYLKKLLLSLKQSKMDKYKIEIIVVDNNSFDGSVDLVKKEFKQVKIICNKDNLGYSKGNNLGANKAGGKYLLFLNSDTRVEEETIINILDFVNKNKKIKVLTCRVELPDKKLDPACHRGFPSPWASFTYFSGLEKLFPKSKIFGQYHLGWQDLAKTHRIDAISGAFFFIKKDLFNKAGKFDEDYFMYGEDLDLCFKLKSLGESVYFYPGAKIIHFKKRSGRKKDLNKDKDNKIVREKTKQHFFETMKIFYDKNYKEKYPWVIKQLVLMGIWIISKVKE